MYLAITISARQDAFRDATFIEEIARSSRFYREIERKSLRTLEDC